ncbi:MAG TPA: hypothetical protein VFZ59_06690 [Verrucomicrobiae bacterium]|nr:hypothetical protein [Verrucomicrobiae bacterium]
MEITTATKNFEAGSATLINLMADLQNGESLARRPGRNELADIANDRSFITSNLNTRGLVGILGKQTNPPPPRTGQPVADNT